MNGSDIIELRERLGLTRTALARKLAVPVDQVIDWENEKRFTTKAHHRALAQLLRETNARTDDE